MFAIVSVTNDLSTDQRVDRTCRTLVKTGFNVLLIGRRRRYSLPLQTRDYLTHRMILLFEKGPLFYAEYNIRLFLFLLVHRADIFVSNDLDTLPANWLAYRWFNLIGGKQAPKLVHDCHEYYRGVPELVGRETVISIWKWLEDSIFPGLQTIYAVNQSIADLYSKEYGKTIKVIRNVPERKSLSGVKDKTSLGILPDRKVILYQGAVNVDRGLEEAIEAMQYVRNDAVLLILGTGDIFDFLNKLVIKKGLETKVILPGAIPLEKLHSYTLMGDIGLSIEKNVCINYFYALPNKFMDYIQANVPVLVSPFPEMKFIVDQYRIGEFIVSHDPPALASKFDQMLDDLVQLGIYRKNLINAASDLCWENEEKKLIDIFSEVIK